MPEPTINPTKDDVDRVLEFLPKLRSLTGQNPEPVELRLDSEGRNVPYINYTEVGLQLLRIFSQEPWHHPNYDREAAKKTVNDPESLASASLLDIKNAFFTLTRVEHFCPGSWEDLINEGVIVKLLERLEEVRQAQRAKSEPENI